MANPPYLAMTAAEFSRCNDLPPRLAWMACHFSVYGRGISNVPRALPKGSMLILNDRIEPVGIDPELVARQLHDVVENLECGGLLLDFQRPDEPETAALVKHLLQHLPCPTSVSHFYAKDLDCPVFLPPVPIDTPVEEYLVPWAGRDIWLEAALGGCILELTESGCVQKPLLEPIWDGHTDETLCCHYQIDLGDTATFRLHRTESDLKQLLRRAESLGVTHTVGLYQELGDFLF